jgi:hypothetical protein
MTKTDSIIPLLVRTDLFNGLDGAYLSACAAAFREIEFAKGQMLFARGDTGNRLYLIAEGRVRFGGRDGRRPRARFPARDPAKLAQIAQGDDV